MVRGRFLGEMSMLTGQRLYLTGVVREAGEVIQVPIDELRKLVAEDKTLSDIFLGAFMARRSILIDVGTGLKLIGSRFSPDTRRLREYLARNRMPHQWIDLEEDENAEALLHQLGVDPADTPVVIPAGGEILNNPANDDVGRAIGIGAKGPPPALCDVLVVGAGPAGLAAAVYAASEGLDTQGIEGVATGGQAGTSARIENYLGFPAGVSGTELTQRAGVQAIKFGVRLTAPATALALRSAPGHHEIELSTGEVATGRSVVIATGAQYRRLDVPRMEEFEMGGVYYAATQAEAQLCADESVVIVGGGNSAGQAAMFLSQHTDELPAADPRRRPRQVHVPLPGRPDRAQREGQGLQAHRGRRARTGTASSRPSRSRTSAPVSDPRIPPRRCSSSSAPRRTRSGSTASWPTDDAGFLLTGRDVEDLAEYDGDRPLFLETCRPGVFAVGDVRSGSIKRVASAVGEGSMAVRLVHERLAALS